VFDQDGTLWVEHPICTQAAFALDRLRELAPHHPEWKRRDPLKAVIEGDRAAISKSSEADWEKIVAATHAGMMNDLRANEFKIYIITGGGQEFVLTHSQRVYGIPPEEVESSMKRTLGRTQEMQDSPQRSPTPLLRMPDTSHRVARVICGMSRFATSVGMAAALQVSCARAAGPQDTLPGATADYRAAENQPDATKSLTEVNKELIEPDLVDLVADIPAE
jgi:hypothetical protein